MSVRFVHALNQIKTHLCPDCVVSCLLMSVFVQCFMKEMIQNFLIIFRERNIVEQVNKIAPKFQDGLKAFSDSPIIGEVHFCL